MCVVFADLAGKVCKTKHVISCAAGGKFEMAFPLEQVPTGVTAAGYLLCKKARVEPITAGSEDTFASSVTLQLASSAS